MRDMVTAGIDLSADVKKTGVARLQWRGEVATVVELGVGTHTDPDLCELIQAVDKTGVDCPLGWPSPFIDYLIAHRAGGHELDVPETRHSLRFRATDLHVIETTGMQPLSVSADRIGSAAMRCAAILSTLTKDGVAVDRTGRTGPVVEVYPAASLKTWRLPHNGYKTPANSSARAKLVDAIGEDLPWLDFGTHAETCIHSDDALDAVICAVVAGLVHRGDRPDIPEGSIPAAEVEGWIALPCTPRQLLYDRWTNTFGNQQFSSPAAAKAATADGETQIVRACLAFAFEDDSFPIGAGLTDALPARQILAMLVDPLDRNAKTEIMSAFVNDRPYDYEIDTSSSDALLRASDVLLRRRSYEEAYGGLPAEQRRQEFSELDKACANLQLLLQGLPFGNEL